MVFTVDVGVVDPAAATVVEVCPDLELVAPLRPLPLAPFLTVLRGVTSLLLGGGVSRVTRVVEVVIAVPVTRVPMRL